MTKTLYYKHHKIELNGIVATVHYEGSYIYKTRFIDASDCLKALKAFINLRLEQIKRDRSIDIYV